MRARYPELSRVRETMMVAICEPRPRSKRIIVWGNNGTQAGLTRRGAVSECFSPLRTDDEKSAVGLWGARAAGQGQRTCIRLVLGLEDAAHAASSSSGSMPCAFLACSLCKHNSFIHLAVSSRCLRSGVWRRSRSKGLRAPLDVLTVLYPKAHVNGIKKKKVTLPYPVPGQGDLFRFLITEHYNVIKRRCNSSRALQRMHLRYFANLR